MKRPQNKFNAHAIRKSPVNRSKKSQNLSFGQTLLLGQNFLAAQVFLFIDTLLKLQQQIFICFCKFSCNSVIIVGLLWSLA